jgi:hypothetical protein
MPEVCAIPDRNRTQVRNAGGTEVTLYRDVRRALCLAVPRIVPHDVERDTPPRAGRLRGRTVAWCATEAEMAHSSDGEPRSAAVQFFGVDLVRQ